jgi:hypothetical protein
MVVNDMFTNMGSIIAIDGSSARDFPVITITSLHLIVPAPGLEGIDLVKVDVEGYEIEVLKGASHTLRIVKRVVLEYHSQDFLQEASAFLIRSWIFESVAGRRAPSTRMWPAAHAPSFPAVIDNTALAVDPLDAEALAGMIAATLNDVAGTALRAGPAAGGTLLMGSESAHHSGCLLPAGANLTDVIMG